MWEYVNHKQHYIKYYIDINQSKDFTGKSLVTGPEKTKQRFSHLIALLRKPSVEELKTHIKDILGNFKFHVMHQVSIHQYQQNREYK